MDKVTIAYRTCTLCRKTLAENKDNFYYKKKQRVYTARCIPCQRKTYKDVYSPLVKNQSKLASKRYRATGRGRAKNLLWNYKKRDACDFTVEELQSAIESPCVYCGTESRPRGLDRVDNKKAHTKDNVVVACTVCNRVRSDLFTPEEMKVLGKAVAKIMQDRRDD